MNYFFILFPCVFAIQTIFAQNYSKLSYTEIDSVLYIEYSNANYREALLLANAGKNKAKAEFGSYDTIYATYLAWEGFVYNAQGQYRPAEACYLQAKKIQEKVLGKEHLDYAASLNNLAGLYINIGNYIEAEPLYLESMAIRQKLLGKEHTSYATILVNLAALYQHIGNYTQAEALLLEAKTIDEKTVGKENPQHANSLNNLAALYIMMGNETKAEPLLLEALTILEKSLGKENPYYAQILRNLADLYSNTKQHGKAEQRYLESIAIIEKILGKEHTTYAENLNNLAVLYEKMGRDSEAGTLYLKANAVLLKAAGAVHPTYITGLNNLSDFYLKQSYLEGVREYLQNALQAVSGLNIGMNVNEAWADSLAEAKYQSVKHIELSVVLLKKVFALLEKDSLSQKKERQIIVADLANRLLKRSRTSFSNESDKLRILGQSHDWMLLGLQVMNLDENAWKSFEIVELNKAALLLEATKAEENYQLGDLPDSLAWKEKEMLLEYARLEANLLESTIGKQQENLRSALNESGQKINRLKKHIETNYPKYAALKYRQTEAKATDIQALFDDRTALLEYVIGDSTLYIFYLDKTHLQVSTAKIPKEQLKQYIHTLHQALSDYDQLAENPAKARQDFCTSAFWCYENLLKPVLKEAKGIDHLIIIPDGELGHLPFETFLMEKPLEKADYADFHYVLNDFKVSYHYSATLWKENMEVKRNKNNGQMLAMAANYSGEVDSLRSGLRLPAYNRLRQVLQALPAAREEVAQLQKSFKGLFGFDNQAAEKIFKEKAGDYAIIHLAMHGLLNEKNPVLSSLAFTEDGDSLENNFLQAYEISKMQLNADLVVLSACETGFGKFEQGNGTASLARAFMYAGVPSLVVSLWQVNDASTSAIMQLFYKNLAKGMDKAGALRQAKLTYIGSVDGMAAHPAFWAPFVQLGDSRPIVVQTRGGVLSMWWIGGGLATLAVVGGGVMTLHRRQK